MKKFRALFAFAELPTKLVLLVFVSALPAFGVSIYSALEKQKNLNLAQSTVDHQSGVDAIVAATRAGITTTLQRDLMLLAIFTLLAMIAAWVLGYVLIRRRVKTLARTSLKLAAGDLSARSGLKDHAGEFGELGRSFDNMAEALADRTAQLVQTQAKYRTILEHIPVITYSYVADSEKTPGVAFVSPQIEKLLGFTPEEWLADPALWSNQLHPEDKERVLAQYANCCEQGEQFVAEYRILSRDGRTLWMLDHARVLTNEEGQIHLMQGMMLDVTERKHLEQTVSESERRYARMIDSAQDAIIAVDEAQRIKLFNKGAEKLFGLEIGEVAGKPINSLFQSDFTLAPGQEADLKIRHKSGIEAVAEASVSQVVLGEQKISTIILRDVTDQRREEAELRERESSFRRIFNDNPLPMWLHDAGNLQFLEVNEAAIAHYGYSREEFLRMSVTDLRATEDVPRLMDKNPTGSFDQLYSLQWRHRRKDGRTLDMEVTSQAWEYGGHDAVLVVAADITERKRAEESLRDSEKRFRAFFEGTALGVAVVDMDGHIVKSNPALHDMLGFSADELRQTTLTNLAYMQETIDSLDILRELVLSEQDHRQVEQRYRRKDGSPVWASVTVSLVRGSKRKPQFSVVMVEDITERKRAQEQIKRQFDRMAALRNIDLTISASLDLRVTLSVILDQVTSQLGVHAADVLLLNSHTQVLEYAAGRGFRHDDNTRTRLRMGEGYAGRAAMQRRTLTTTDFTDTGDLLRAPLLSGEDFVSYSAVPLQAKGQVKGVLEVFHREALNPDPEWLDFFEALAAQAAIAIDNAAMFNDLQRSNMDLALAYDVTLEGWSRALDLRDEETEGHTRRVTEMTMRLAKYMGMNDADLLHLHRGALLHDIGKMGIPDSILLKPGPLTEEEWAIMRKHPSYAFELLSPISFLKPALDIPYCHHEKWDGTGYPRGLKEEQIPLAARIFAVVDVWDALRSDRPYRKAWHETRVRRHIRSLSGTHFDPRVVDAFLEIEVPVSKFGSTAPLEGLLEYMESLPEKRVADSPAQNGAQVGYSLPH
jgi:PAS domain S-box-containing protein